MANYKVETIYPCFQLGEGPHWDVASQSLYYVSLSEGLLLRYDYGQDKVYQATVDGIRWASFLIPVKGRKNEFVIGDGNRLLVIGWDGISSKGHVVKELANVGEAEQHNRFNDGKVDPEGRLYAGTMLMDHLGKAFDRNTGVFYRFDAKANQLVPLKRHVFISNGLTWNARTKKLYYVDSGTYDIKEFDVDPEGNLVNEKVWFDFKVNGSHPGYFGDGMTIDTEGNLYVAAFTVSKVLKISPDKRVVQEINIPAQQVTSVAFGGPNLDVLFVTTAGKEVVGPQKPPAGALFKITGLGVRGLPMNEMQLDA